MDMKKAYEQKLAAQLDEWGSEIDNLKAKADKAEADAQIEYYKQIAELRAKHESIQKKLKEFKEAGEGAWKDLKTGIDLAWNSLGAAVQSANARFK